MAKDLKQLDKLIDECLDAGEMAAADDNAALAVAWARIAQATIEIRKLRAYEKERTDRK